VLTYDWTKNGGQVRHTLISPEEIRKCQTKSGSKHLKAAEK